MSDLVSPILKRWSRCEGQYRSKRGVAGALGMSFVSVNIIFLDQWYPGNYKITTKFSFGVGAWNLPLAHGL